MSSMTCEFCHLLLTTCITEPDQQTNSSTGDQEEVNFYRIGSHIMINNRATPGLSICTTRVDEIANDSLLSEIQLGFPLLPEIKSPEYYNVLRQWLQDCDTHPGCRLDNIMTESRTVPTRLIDVETTNSAKVYLTETKRWEESQKSDLRYIALSHPWGNPQHHRHFSTTRKNITHRLGDGILFDDLPDTFKDAVAVTRQLGVRYLWIDSLCIIQGDDGDFKYEAEFMESVFSFAYCVIAASRATGTSDGFLKQRPDRKFVQFPMPSGGGGDLYFCEAIDDFQGDVIDGALNKRGWVLQERALARRTIYFTDKQTYWECGDGIRCETLTKMQNNKAAFLGDPAFPKVAIKSSKGGRIRLYESLYRQYSSLEFTKASDRPIAIAGLEQRLIRAFGEHGGFGIFDRYFGRSLLWHRDGDAPMKAIEFATQQYRVPTWSWMAYQGRITFMDVKFDTVQWEETQIRSPWINHDSSSSRWHTGYTDSNTYLRGRARGLNLALASKHIICDKGNPPPQGREIKCIIVGKQRAEVEQNVEVQVHYVLVVAKSLDSKHDVTYERVGIGALLGSWIDLDGNGLAVRIR
ncbi:heterokaryon incompatibility protein-domain-containing protein [Mariannaea sp. PMI_226]|nr:heterokaryon incompatibility protein-domain-containing protein [Mariannaea sp. PMI_226]